MCAQHMLTIHISLFRTKVMIVFTIVVLTILANPSEEDPESQYVITSCSNQDSEWIEGSGMAIQSFLQSIVPAHPNSRSQKVSATFWEKRGFSSQVERLWLSDAGTRWGWRRFGRSDVDGWLYGSFDNPDMTTGLSISYIFSDMETALSGFFLLGNMIEARASTVQAHRCHGGLLQLRIEEDDPIFEKVFFTEFVTSSFITSMPRVPDPYDKKHVYVHPSRLVIGEEGLFAKKGFVKDQLIAHYAGYLVRQTGKLFSVNMTVEQFEERHKNLMTLERGLSLDQPEADLVHYRATLGHKANHAFGESRLKNLSDITTTANAQFCKIRSPRFGDICCIKALRRIRKNEEIFVDYNYDILSIFIPSWYFYHYFHLFPNEDFKMRLENARQQSPFQLTNRTR